MELKLLEELTIEVKTAIGTEDVPYLEFNNGELTVVIIGKGSDWITIKVNSNLVSCGIEAVLNEVLNRYADHKCDLKKSRYSSSKIPIEMK